MKTKFLLLNIFISGAEIDVPREGKFKFTEIQAEISSGKIPKKKQHFTNSNVG